MVKQVASRPVRPSHVCQVYEICLTIVNDTMDEFRDSPQKSTKLLLELVHREGLLLSETGGRSSIGMPHQPAVAAKYLHSSAEAKGEDEKLKEVRIEVVSELAALLCKTVDPRVPQPRKAQR